ncbi:MAG TPA: DUF4132 domain-containing protein, partial [Candidatus Methylacidiphilales bacterium]|nr:DUF4132 domain-containing protein [Candidatus Methylacidiphilales bacterium]
TAGTRQEKKFSSDAMARKEHDKLVDEKLKKGYSEIGLTAVGGASVTPSATATAAATVTATSAPTPAAATSATAPESASPSAPEPLPRERTMELDAELLAEWRALLPWTEEWRTVSVRPAPRRFDIQERKKELTEHVLSRKRPEAWVFEIPATLSREEAVFWISTLRQTGKAYEDFEPVPSLCQDIRAWLERQPVLATYWNFFHYPQLFIPFYSPLEIARMFRQWSSLAEPGSDEPLIPHNGQNGARAADGFSRAIVPFMSLAERDELRAEFEALFDKEQPDKHLNDKEAGNIAKSQTTLKYGRGEMITGLLAAVGSSRVARWLNALPDMAMDSLFWWRHGKIFLLAGAGTEEDFRLSTCRLMRKLPSIVAVQLWIAATEWRSLDIVVATIRQAPEYVNEGMIEALAGVNAPETAMAMLELALQSAVRGHATDWFAIYPTNVVIGLTPVAAALQVEGFRGSRHPNPGLVEPARQQLLSLMRRGDLHFIRLGLPHLSAEHVEWLRREVMEGPEEQLKEIHFDEDLPEPLREVLEENEEDAEENVPEWLDIFALPWIKVGEGRLSESAIESVIMILSYDLPEDADDEIAHETTVLKQTTDPRSLETFAWAIFQAWLRAGTPVDAEWGFTCLGHVGGDDTALRLHRMFTAWSPTYDSCTTRDAKGKVTGIVEYEVLTNWLNSEKLRYITEAAHCLKAIGTDTARMLLADMVRKLKYGLTSPYIMEALDELARKEDEQMPDTALRLEEEAEAVMDSIAGINHIVPTCGFSVEGTRTFGVGQQRYQFSLGAAPDFRPQVREIFPDRTLSDILPDDIPMPAPGDALAAARYAEGRLILETTALAMKIQCDRLEDAMATCYYWERDDLTELFLDNPLMRHLARGLIFGSFDTETNEPFKVFRIDKDLSLIDEYGDEEELYEDACLGIVHPVQLKDYDVTKWKNVLKEEGITQPFNQMGREYYRLHTADEGETEITRFKDVDVEGTDIYAILRRDGWIHAIPAESGGSFYSHSKHFSTAECTAYIRYDAGLEIDDKDWTLNITEIFFCHGTQPRDSEDCDAERLTIENVDPTVLTEALRPVKEICKLSGEDNAGEEGDGDGEEEEED